MQVLILEHHPHLCTSQHSGTNNAPYWRGSLVQRQQPKRRSCLKSGNIQIIISDDENLMLNLILCGKSPARKANVCKVHALVKQNLRF